MKLQKLINELLDYGLKKNILDERDLVYSTNLLIDIFGIHEFKEFRRPGPWTRSSRSGPLAYERNIIASTIS